MEFTQDPIIKLVFSILSVFGSYWLAYLLLRTILGIFCSLIVAKWLAHGFLVAYLFGLLFAILIIQSYPSFKPHMLLMMLYGILLVINILIIPFYYWLDKRTSTQEDKMRIPENVLHTLAFAGGGISAFISQRVFRHKTQKKAFHIITPIAILSSVFIFYVLIKYRPEFV